jgi:tetratricopeptide (TPR) repeat protein
MNSDPFPYQVPAQEEQPPPPKKTGKRRRIIVGLVLVALVVILAFQARPLYSGIKGWRARGLIKEVNTLIEKGEWKTASEKGMAAYHLKPDEPAVLRALARLQSLTQNPRGAILFWKALLAQPKEVTAEDRVIYADDLLRAGAAMEALQVTRGLLEQRSDDPAALRLMSKIQAVQNEYQESLRFARRALAIAPDDPENQLLVALLEIDSPDQAERMEAWSKIGKIAQSKENIGLRALIFIAQRRDIPSEMIDHVVTGLREHPGSNVTHRLLAYDVQIRRNPAQRSALLDQAMEEFKGDRASLQIVGPWLNSRGEFNRTLQIIPRSEAKQLRDAFLTHVDALAGLKQWPELEKLLKEPGLPLDEAYSQIFQARVALEMSKPELAKYHWQQAYVAAARKPEQLSFLASYAEKIGAHDIAERAYRALFSNPAWSLGAYQGVLRILQRKGDALALRDLLAEMTARWPENASILNDYAYLSLLLNQRVDESLQTARLLVQKAPRSLPHRTTLALGLVRIGQPAEALKVYSSLDVKWESALPSNRAIYAVVLAANGKMAEARAQELLIPGDALLKQEQALLKEWVKPPAG